MVDLGKILWCMHGGALRAWPRRISPIMVARGYEAVDLHFASLHPGPWPHIAEALYLMTSCQHHPLAETVAGVWCFGHIRDISNWWIPLQLPDTSLVPSLSRTSFAIWIFQHGLFGTSLFLWLHYPFTWFLSFAILCLALIYSFLFYNYHHHHHHHPNYHYRSLYLRPHVFVPCNSHFDGLIRYNFKTSAAKVLGNRFHKSKYLKRILSKWNVDLHCQVLWPRRFSPLVNNNSDR